LQSNPVSDKDLSPWPTYGEGLGAKLEGATMVDTYESLNERFSIVNVVIEHLRCADTEKALLKELFVTIYGVAYRDGRREAKAHKVAAR
jgi:hypothetical protein